MKFIKNNKGVLLFYSILAIATFIMVKDVERETILDNNNNYVAIINNQ